MTKFKEGDLVIANALYLITSIEDIPDFYHVEERDVLVRYAYNATTLNEKIPYRILSIYRGKTSNEYIYLIEEQAETRAVYFIYEVGLTLSSSVIKKGDVVTILENKPNSYNLSWFKKYAPSLIDRYSYYNPSIDMNYSEEEYYVLEVQDGYAAVAKRFRSEPPVFLIQTKYLKKVNDPYPIHEDK